MRRQELAMAKTRPRPNVRAAASLCCVIAAALCACDAVSPIGPIGPIPGGKLQGDLTAAPVSDWSFTDRFETFELETRPSRPYSVTTWGIASNGDFYVPSRDPQEKAWVQHVLSDPRVRLRVGQALYELRADRVRDGAEFDRAVAKLAKKYSLDRPSGDAVGSVWLFRLIPRS